MTHRLGIEPGRGGQPDHIVVRRVCGRLRENLVVILPELSLLLRADPSERELAGAVVNGAGHDRIARLIQRKVLEEDSDPSPGLRHEVGERSGEIAAERAEEVGEFHDLNGRLRGALRGHAREVEIDFGLTLEILGGFPLLIRLELLRVVEGRLELLRVLLGGLELRSQPGVAIRITRSRHGLGLDRRRLAHRGNRWRRRLGRRLRRSLSFTEKVGLLGRPDGGERVVESPDRDCDHHGGNRPDEERAATLVLRGDGGELRSNG